MTERKRNLHFQTLSGTHYEIDRENARIRRSSPANGNAKRGDEEWLNLYKGQVPFMAEGFPVIIELESLAALGPDDHGTLDPHPEATTRTTTRVSRIWEEDA